MIKLLVKTFISNYEEVEDKDVREKYGILGGILGVICNFVLFGIKVSIGIVTNSIAIISDAFNNLSDVGSSAVAIIGAKMSNMHPDKEHPFGHGRFEYISALIVSFIIIIVGIELFKTSLDKLFNPAPVVFNIILIAILMLSTLIKVWMFLYNKYLGEKINSGILKATSTDSLNDVWATGAVIISAILGKFVSFPVDAAMGLIVSILIVYSGFNLAKETVSTLLGQPPEEELVNKLYSMILESNGIIGVHDLIVHDYGPGRVMASVHAEVPSDVNLISIHEIIDATEQRIYNKLGINIVIHMDPVLVSCEKTNKIKGYILSIVTDINENLTIHDFRMTDGENNINLIFDLVMPWEMKQNQQNEIVNQIKDELKEIDKRFNAVIKIDNLF